MDKDEVIKQLQEQDALRIRQLKEAVATLEELTNQVREAAPAIREGKTNDPAVQKLIARFEH